MPEPSWSASSAGATLFHVRRAQRATGICASTAGTPSGASRAVTATPPSATVSTLSTLSRWIPSSGFSACCSSPPPSWRRPGTFIEKIGHRASWAPEKVLITGAGPIGLLAALLATQRGYQTYVLDRVTEGRKPEMVRRLGATYFHVGDLGEAGAEADIVIECTGFVQMLLEAGPQHVRHRITCLTGVSPGRRRGNRRPGTLQPQHRLAELRHIRLGQRQPASLRTRRQSSRPSRSRLARRPDHPPGAARPVERRLHPQTGRHQDHPRLSGRITLAATWPPELI